MDQREIIGNVLEVILRPVVKLCLRYSIKIKDLGEILKKVFVQVAVDELTKSGQEISVSRVNVMTGVHRAEAARTMAGKPPSTRTVDVITKVIGQWRGNKKYLSASGSPRVLSSEGMESEFVSLVQSVSMDLNPYTVLFELERSGFISKSTKGVKLVGSVYIPKEIHEGYSLLADDVEDLMETVQQNITGDERDRSLHIKTEYDNIPLESLPEIRSWIRKQGSQFHSKVRDFLSRYDRDVDSSESKGTGRVRVALASFSRVEIIDRSKKVKKE